MKQGPGPIAEAALLLYTDTPPKVYGQEPPTGVVDLARLFITLRSQAAQLAAQQEVTN